MTRDPKKTPSSEPTQAEITAFQLGRAVGRQEGAQRPCAPAGRRACDLPAQEPSPSASGPQGQPAGQQAGQQGQRKAAHDK